MAFIDSTSSQRVELLRQAEKTANLTRRVTVGSGVLGAPEGVEGDALCNALSESLAVIGYPDFGDARALVEDAQDIDVIDSTGLSRAVLPAKVAYSYVQGVVLPNATAVVTNSLNVPLQNSRGTTVGNPATVVVSGSTLTSVKAPTTSAVVTATTNPLVQNSNATVSATGTVTVTNGAIASIRLPADRAIVTTGMSSSTIPVSGTYTSTVTFTVAGGLIIGIALS